MCEFTAYYGTRDGSSLLPVAATAACYADAVTQFDAWRVRKSADPAHHALISPEPVRIVNETIRMEWEPAGH